MPVTIPGSPGPVPWSHTARRSLRLAASHLEVWCADTPRARAHAKYPPYPQSHRNRCNGICAWRAGGRAFAGGVSGVKFLCVGGLVGLTVACWRGMLKVVAGSPGTRPFINGVEIGNARPPMLRRRRGRASRMDGGWRRHLHSTPNPPSRQDPGRVFVATTSPNDACPCCSAPADAAALVRHLEADLQAARDALALVQSELEACREQLERTYRGLRKARGVIMRSRGDCRLHGLTDGQLRIDRLCVTALVKTTPGATALERRRSAAWGDPGRNPLRSACAE